MIGVIVVMLIILELGFYGLASMYEANNKGTHDPRIDSDIYKDVNWAEDYYKEFDDSFNAEYFQYAGYKRLPNFNGTYINIDSNSLRKTINRCNNSNATKIFMFGGSTMWGSGSRDVGTIPSHLSKQMCKAGYNVEVTNFGESGYTSSQEVIRFQMELKKGNIPDIVIFYDGVNDVYSTYQNEIAGLPQNVINRKQDFNSRERYNLFPNFFKGMNKISKNNFARISNDTLNNDTADVYGNNIKLIKSLENDYGFKSYFFWQPSIYTKQILSYAEMADILRFVAVDKDYNNVTKLINNYNVTNLAHVFNFESQTFYLDWCHISEDGNSVVAKKITEVITNE